jgi:hypothetical protein
MRGHAQFLAMYAREDDDMEVVVRTRDGVHGRKGVSAWACELSEYRGRTCRDGDLVRR